MRARLSLPVKSIVRRRREALSSYLIEMNKLAHLEMKLNSNLSFSRLRESRSNHAVLSQYHYEMMFK